MTNLEKFVQPAIPKFDGYYDHWSLLMENFLRSKEMWSVVDEGVTAVAGTGTGTVVAQKKAIDDAKLTDMKVKNYLFQAIDREILETILDKSTSKGIWDSMKQKYQGSTKVKRARLQALRKEYELLCMKEGERVDTYIARTLTVVNKMKVNGDSMIHDSVVSKLLRSLTPRFNYVVCSIMESNDLGSMSLDELHGSLLVHEQLLLSQREEEQVRGGRSTFDKNLENLPISALPDDSVVEIQGEPTGVHKAIELIATHLRKFQVDRSVIGIFEMQMQTPNARPNQEMPPPQWAPSPQGFPGGGPGFGPSQFMPPQHQFDNFYPRVDMPPPMDKQPRQGPPPSDPPNSAPVQLLPQQSRVTKVSQNMQIPLSYACAVIGPSGTNISYIRRASGATIAFQETRGVPDEMTVEINGSASQVQTAQQLIQNFVADAATAAQNSTAPPPSQAYNPYPGHAPAFGSQPPPAGHAPPPAKYSGPVYGGNYRY